jgi:hypothetical protein
MSRALNIDATLEHVTNTCQKHKARISSIEKLPGGCTRVVLATADAAAIIQRAYGKNVVTGPLARTPLALASRGVPITQDIPVRAAPSAGPFARRM